MVDTEVVVGVVDAAANAGAVEVTEREEEMVGAVHTASGSLGCGQVVYIFNRIRTKLANLIVKIPLSCQ